MGLRELCPLNNVVYQTVKCPKDTDGMTNSVDGVWSIILFAQTCVFDYCTI